MTLLLSPAVVLVHVCLMGNLNKVSRQFICINILCVSQPALVCARKKVSVYFDSFWIKFSLLGIKVKLNKKYSSFQFI